MTIQRAKYAEIIREIEKFCYDREDPVKAIRNMRDFTEGYDAFGIDYEEMKVIRNRILEESKLEVPELAELGLILMQTGKYELGTLAIMLLKKHRPRLNSYIRDLVKEMLDTAVENWAHTDFLAEKILPVFFELGLDTLESFEIWLQSESKWTRRATIISLMNMRKALDMDEILSFILPVIEDRQQTVQQAISWLMADLWHKNGERVEAFLDEHFEKLSPTVLKQVSAQMPAAKAKRYRPKPKRKPKAKQKPFKSQNQAKQAKPKHPPRNYFKSRNKKNEPKPE